MFYKEEKKAFLVEIRVRLLQMSAEVLGKNFAVWVEDL
jgi:hypothetical protein